MRRTVLSAAARAYLHREAAYLRRHDPGAARRFADRIATALKSLASFENIGASNEDLPLDGLRRLIVGDYLVFYEANAHETRILFIRHGRQSPVIGDDRPDYEIDPDGADKPSSSD